MTLLAMLTDWTIHIVGSEPSELVMIAAALTVELLSHVLSLGLLKVILACSK
jgi:hypothetical protein